MTEQQQQGTITPIEMAEEIRTSFLEYSMSVIVSRAIPDARDGLKPVHRRILYALYDQGMTHDKPHRKSANIVGEVMGKYHPHGDSAIYEAMVKQAQPWAMRYPLIDGHGNFGSIDGDSAAAMRYTESRMSKMAMEMLKDINKDTINWVPNYDDSRKEPTVLPARIPNLLINGSAGIAVGMATNMPPHNLGETVEGLKYLIDHPDCSTEELMEYVPAPDFPTGGILMGTKSVKQAYKTGRGSIKVRSRHIIETNKGKQSIIVTEIPYQVNKARLIEKIAELVRDKKVEGISDLRDESDMHGIRIAIELKKDANAEVILNNLYKHTQLEDSFGINNLCLVGGEPKLLGMKDLMSVYIKHRQEVITRRTNYELSNAQARLHIVEGLIKAIGILDEVIATIRGSKDRETARIALIEKFEFTEIQANAILDMQLARLTGLEINKLTGEQGELIAFIADMQNILANPERIMTLIKTDLDDVKEKYGDRRRTEITGEALDVSEEDFIDEEDIIITLSDKGYIKRQSLDSYKTQKRGGQGVNGTNLREEDFTRQLLVTTTHTTLLFFTDKGRVYSLKGYQIPEASKQAKGLVLINLLELKDEQVTEIIGVKKFTEEAGLLMATREGTVKKVALSDLSNIRKCGIIAINLGDDDQLIGVRVVNPHDKVILTTAFGMSIVFSEEQIRVMGRAAAGIRGIKLQTADQVIDMDILESGKTLTMITELGYGKRVNVEEFKEQNRGGRGLRSIEINRKNGNLTGAKITSQTDEIMILTLQGQIIRLKTEEVPIQKRPSRGVITVKLGQDDKVITLQRVEEQADGSGTETVE